jgi:hypothetical protein
MFIVDLNIFLGLDAAAGASDTTIPTVSDGDGSAPGVTDPTATIPDILQGQDEWNVRFARLMELRMRMAARAAHVRCIRGLTEMDIFIVVSDILLEVSYLYLFGLNGTKATRSTQRLQRLYTQGSH